MVDTWSWSNIRQTLNDHSGLIILIVGVISSLTLIVSCINCLITNSLKAKYRSLSKRVYPTTSSNGHIAITSDTRQSGLTTSPLTQSNDSNMILSNRTANTNHRTFNPQQLSTPSLHNSNVHIAANSDTAQLYPSLKNQMN